MNLAKILATERRERPFLSEPGGACWSYGELDRLAGGMAGALAARGVAPGDRVVGQLDKSPAALALYLAALRIGAIYVPLNPSYTSSESEALIDDAAPRLVVREAELRSLERQAAVTADPGVAAVDASAPAALLYTSGTTGRAKGAVLSHGNLAANARALHRAWGWRDDDVLLHALPIFHVHGLFISLHTAMLGASEVLFLPRFEIEAVRAALPRATVMMGVPTYYTRLLDDPTFDAGSCRHLRLFVSGSAPLSERTFAEFASRTGQSILERYGMTETGVLTSNPLDGERIAGSVGYPLEGVELRITDQVEVRGPGVFSGYWQAPEKSAAAFSSDGFFRTGDLGRQQDDGRLYLSGRAVDLIISGGFNVYPAEVERCLAGVPGVVEAAVVGVPHDDLGEVPVGVWVGESDEGVIEGVLQEHLARFKRPRALRRVEALPRNTMGKVQKDELRRRFADLFRAG